MTSNRFPPFAIPTIPSSHPWGEEKVSLLHFAFLQPRSQATWGLGTRLAFLAVSYLDDFPLANLELEGPVSARIAVKYLQSELSMPHDQSHDQSHEYHTAIIDTPSQMCCSQTATQCTSRQLSPP